MRLGRRDTHRCVPHRNVVRALLGSVCVGEALGVGIGVELPFGHAGVAVCSSVLELLFGHAVPSGPV